MQEDSSRNTCARVETILRWQRKSQSLRRSQEWGTAKSPLCYFTLYHLFLGKGSIHRRLIQGYPSMSWMTPQWAWGILRLPLLEQLLGTVCEMGDWKQHFCHSAFSRAMDPPGILRTREDIFAYAHVLWAVWFFSLLGRYVLTGRYQAQKNVLLFLP